MKLKLLSILVTTIPLLSACSIPENGIQKESSTTVVYDSNIDVSQYNNQNEACTNITDKAVLECQHQNGVFRRAGMMGCYHCIVDYADAGKSCTSSSDCEGTCRAKENNFVPTGVPNQTGECSINNNIFGCYQIIEKGVAQSALCID